MSWRRRLSAFLVLAASTCALSFFGLFASPVSASVPAVSLVLPSPSSTVSAVAESSGAVSPDSPGSAQQLAPASAESSVPSSDGLEASSWDDRLTNSPGLTAVLTVIAFGFGLGAGRVLNR